MTSEQCPKCGAKYPEPFAFEGPWRYYNQILHQEDGPDCLRNQLAQAQERERAALARNAQLRELLDRHQWSADGCPECGEFESDGHADWCELATALADASANPLAAYTDGQLYDELRRRGWKAATWAEEGGKLE